MSRLRVQLGYQLAEAVGFARSDSDGTAKRHVISVPELFVSRDTHKLQPQKNERFLCGFPAAEPHRSHRKKLSVKRETYFAKTKRGKQKEQKEKAAEKPLSFCADG